ncbi:MAG: DUF4097 domain-containing protein [Acidobacteria bacterium]|nr:DUF4097 domain-containing protein [Acidobacteriota bacterium]
MSRLLRPVALLAAPLLLAVGAQAQRLEKSFPADAGTIVDLRSHVGQVRLHGWSQPLVKVVAVSSGRAAEPHLEKKAERLHIHTHLLNPGAPAAERVVDYEIWAPPDVELGLYLESGSILVENFTQDVRIEAPAADVRLSRIDGRASVETLSGRIDVERCAGRLELMSISGSIHLRDNESRYVVAKSTSGDIFYDGGLQRGGSYEFRNNNGATELVLPASASFELNAQSSEGEVTNEFPFIPRAHGRAPRGPYRSLLGTVQSGDAVVRATSLSGRIRVRKR